MKKKKPKSRVLYKEEILLKDKDTITRTLHGLQACGVKKLVIRVTGIIK